MAAAGVEAGWPPPSPAGTVSSPVTSYEVWVSVDGADPAPLTGDCATPNASPCTVTGLTAGAVYAFVVYAVNAAGTGSASTASVAVQALGAPSEPTDVGVTAADSAVVVTWSPPAGVTGITGYTAFAEPGGHSCAGDTDDTTCTITGLTNGTAYTITVVAHAASGDSPRSAPADVVPSAPPGRPTAVVGAAGTSSIVVTLAAPDPGSGILDYVVTADPGPATCEPTGTECVFGAVAGTPYTFTVVARGRYGRDSAPSDPSDPVTASPPVLPAELPSSDATLTTD